jgi:hypothetical protein
MSFSFVVEAKDGKLSIAGDAPVIHVPDGKFQVSGHVPEAGGGQESLSVIRWDDKGNQVAQATAAVAKST